MTAHRGLDSTEGVTRFKEDLRDKVPKRFVSFSLFQLCVCVNQVIDLVKRLIDMIVEDPSKGESKGRDVSIGFAAECIHLLLSAGDTNGHVAYLKSVHSLVLPATPFCREVLHRPLVLMF